VGNIAGNILGGLGKGDFGEKIFDIAKDVAPPILIVIATAIIVVLCIIFYMILKQRREEW